MYVDFVLLYYCITYSEHWRLISFFFSGWYPTLYNHCKCYSKILFIEVWKDIKIVSALLSFCKKETLLSQKHQRCEMKTGVKFMFWCNKNTSIIFVEYLCQKCICLPNKPSLSTFNCLEKIIFFLVLNYIISNCLKITNLSLCQYSVS